MKKEFLYVNFRKTYPIQLRALALYGGQKDGIESYCLTSHVTKTLTDAINEYKETTYIRIKRAVVEGKERRDAMKEERRERAREGHAAKKREEKARRSSISGARKSSVSTAKAFKRSNCKGSNLVESKIDLIELKLLISPRAGMRPRYETKDGKIIVSPRLMSTLNPQAGGNILVSPRLVSEKSN